MERFLLVCLAGALGTGTRYLVGLLAVRWFGSAVPAGTLSVNLVGCFLMAVVMALAAQEGALSDTTRVLLTTGFMGGLTTYSAFNFEATRLWGARPAWALGYFAVTSLGCLGAGLLGALVARRWG